MVILDRGMSLKIQPPTYGQVVTILSLDGGGIRGLIAGVILHYLESQLQVCNMYNYCMIITCFDGL